MMEIVVALILGIIWLICGMYGFHILSSQHYDLFKIGWDRKKNLIMTVKILLGPIFLVWAITESKGLKAYWDTISHAPRIAKSDDYDYDVRLKNPRK